ncbi:MAG: hypothetical protein CBC09_01290 [Cellvibrionales bacterium TMED49]|nr:hypothetical protein [Porticoccaceae bacterium]OUU39913.1 MAG: hypothetical protein CBC09_01290 [Cellvibrionales bacterium TMED49]|tara:strand:+ start:625 stop:1998 length:1374 start_codon:yes stop_codon:yes gene_type:complete
MNVDGKTKFLTSGDLTLAYQIFGNAAQDLIIVPGIVSHIEFSHEMPGYSSFINELAKYFRVITFDKRGNGMSGKIDKAATLEQRMDDLRLIMESLESRKAIIFGFSEGGSLSALFSAMYPDLVDRLIIFGGFAHVPDLDFSNKIPGFFRKMAIDFFLRKLTRKYEINWGNGDFARTALPPRIIIDGNLRTKLQKFENLSSSPEKIGEMMYLTALLDIRPFLKDVQCPTLILHCRDDNRVPFDWACELKNGIRDSEFIELNGVGHLFYMNESQLIMEKILEFVGKYKPSESDTENSRVLSTILFNDIVNSTQLQFEVGDNQWKEKILEFNSLCKEQIASCDGIFVKSMGDGILATFDGPSRAINCACRINEGVRSLGLTVRSGLHVGEIERIDGDISGINVNAAARIQALAKGGQVLVSEVLKSLVFGSNIEFSDSGLHHFKGFETKWKLFQVNFVEV